MFLKEIFRNNGLCFINFREAIQRSNVCSIYSPIIREDNAHNEILSSLIKNVHHSYLSSFHSIQSTI